MPVTKKDIGDHIAAVHNLTKVEANNIVDDVFDSIAFELDKGSEVAIYNFGKFVTVRRDARTGRNPGTGAAIQILAKNVVQFKPAKTLKDIVN